MCSRPEMFQTVCLYVNIIVILDSENIYISSHFMTPLQTGSSYCCSRVTAADQFLIFLEKNSEREMLNSCEINPWDYRWEVWTILLEVYRSHTIIIKKSINVVILFTRATKDGYFVIYLVSQIKLSKVYTLSNSARKLAQTW